MMINPEDKYHPYFENIRKWAEDRNLIDGSTPHRQMVKLMEEVQELQDGLDDDNEIEIVDAIGDCIVVLTIMATQMNYFVEDCIGHAWEQIKDRKGRMVDGVFVKDV